MKGIILAILAALLWQAPAFAHGVNVFAWLENDQIIVQCDFGRDRPAANAEITIFDDNTKQKLLNGASNAQGRFTFTVPSVVRQGHGLLIDVNAGQGHRGEWTMDASELYAAASLTAGFDEAALKGAQADHAHVQIRPAAPMPAGSVTQEQVKDIVEQALELKLAPMRQELAKSAAKGPTLTEILGGIGWIIGLVGVGLYFKARKA